MRSPLCDLARPRYGMVDPAPKRSGLQAQPGHRDRRDQRVFDFGAERAESSESVVGHVMSGQPPGQPEGMSCSLAEPAGLSSREPIKFLAP